MNNEKLDRLLTLLAAAGVNPAEFRDMHEAIRNSHPFQVDERYGYIRASIRKIHLSNGQKNLSAHRSSTATRVRDDVMRFAQQSSSNPREAAQRLRERLNMTLENMSALPAFSTKEGFGRWLERVMRIVSPNEVLNAAVAEFSSSHSGSRDGWGLSDI